MARKYYGDIEGNFLLGIQDFSDVGFFGGNEEEVYDTDLDGEMDFSTQVGIFFSFFPRHEAKVKQMVEVCDENLGSWLPKLESYFERASTFNEEKIAREFGAEPSDVREMLAWYAKFEIGNKILECLQKKGQCFFNVDFY